MAKVRNRLAVLARRKGLRHRDIVRAAEDLGFKDITYSKLNYWAANKNQPQVQSAFNLCNILGCSIDEFFKVRVRNGTSGN